jgi:hypothetical protein
MERSTLATALSMVGAGVAGLFTVTCELGQPPPDQTADALNCDGRPQWCLIATSEMDERRPAYIYMDGEMKGLVLPSKTKRIPVAAGETHEVSFCAYFDVAGRKRWECTLPTNAKFDAGNSTMVVSPTVTTLVACNGPNDPHPRC